MKVFRLDKLLTISSKWWIIYRNKSIVNKIYYRILECKFVKFKRLKNYWWYFLNIYLWRSNFINKKSKCRSVIFVVKDFITNEIAYFIWLLQYLLWPLTFYITIPMMENILDGSKMFVHLHFISYSSSFQEVLR